MKIPSTILSKMPGKEHVGAGVLLLVTVASVAAATWQGVVWNDNRQSDARRDDAIEVASEQVLDLTTLDTENVDSQLAAMEERMSGDFKRQLEGFSETFADVVNADNIEAVGEIKSVAVADYGADTAEVLVATTVQVTHGKQAKETQRDYRMRVDLERDGDAWLITGMEFVG